MSLLCIEFPVEVEVEVEVVEVMVVVVATSTKSTCGHSLAVAHELIVSVAGQNNRR